MSLPMLLVVDAHHAVCDLLRHHGARSGFQVFAAANSREAIGRLRERPIDLVIVDVDAPQSGGLEVLRYLQQAAPGCRTALMTASDVLDAAVEALRAGAMDIVTKPLHAHSVDVLLDSMRQELEWRRRVFEIALHQASGGPASRPIAGITSGAERLLQAMLWHATIRDLRVIAEHACVLSGGNTITERELRLALPRTVPAPDARDAVTGETGPPLPTLSRLERDHVLRALERARGNKKAAAEMLGVSRRAFYRRLERLALGETIARRRDRGADRTPADAAAPIGRVAHA